MHPSAQVGRGANNKACSLLVVFETCCTNSPSTTYRMYSMVYLDGVIGFFLNILLNTVAVVLANLTLIY